MARSTPTTQEISGNIIASIETELGRSFSLLPKSFTRVLAKALSGVFVLTYRYAGWSLLQQFVAHASWRETVVNGKTIRPLVEWGRLVGVGDPIAATNASFNVVFGIINQDGSTLEAGRQLVHPSSGVIYLTQSAVTLDNPFKTVTVTAASDPNGNGGAGTQGNRDPGDILKWANPIPQVDVQGAAALATVFTTGADAESESDYRQRVIDAFAAPPQGGAYADYDIWASTVEGIANVYPYTGFFPGTVDIYIEATEASSIDGEGSPTEAQKQAVRDAINFDSGGLATRRPVSAVINVKSITRQAFNVVIQGLVAVDGKFDETKTAIQEALDDYLRSREPFIVGVSRLPRKDRITSSAIAGVVDDVASSQGATVTNVTLQLSGATIPAYTLDFGQKAKLNRPIEWT